MKGADMNAFDFLFLDEYRRESDPERQPRRPQRFRWPKMPDFKEKEQPRRLLAALTARLIVLITMR
jgi:hypothetical protein